MEASEVTARAQQEAAAVNREAEQEHEDLLMRLRRLRALVEQLEAGAEGADHPLPSPPPPPPATEEPKEERVVVSLDDRAEDAAPGAAVDGEVPRRAMKQSRSARRSASLPSLGRDANKVLGDMSSLRKERPPGAEDHGEADSA